MTDVELRIEQIRLERKLNNQNIRFSINFKEWQKEMKVKLEEKWDKSTIKTYTQNESILRTRIDKLETELELLKMRLLNYGE